MNQVDEEEADLEVELINLDYNFRPISSPPYRNQQQHQQHQQRIRNYYRMAGISDYRRAGGGYHGFYDQGDQAGQHPNALQGHHGAEDYASGRVSASRGEYYGGTNRAVSPYGPVTYSPRLGPSTYTPIGGDPFLNEGGHSRASTRNFTLNFNTPPGISPSESPEGCYFKIYTRFRFPES